MSGDTAVYHVTLKNGSTMLITAPYLEDRGETEFQESFAITRVMYAINLSDEDLRWCPVCEWSDREVFRPTAKGEEYLRQLQEVAE